MDKTTPRIEAAPGPCWRYLAIVALAAAALAGCAMPTLKPRSAACTLAVLLAPLAGCESTPFASEELDRNAKQFSPATAEAQIYVTRPSLYGGAKLWQVLIDDEPVAMLSVGTYAMVVTTPGPHRVEIRTAESRHGVDIVAEGGGNSFFEAKGRMGTTQARAVLQVIPIERGKELVLAGHRVAALTDPQVGPS